MRLIVNPHKIEIIKDEAVNEHEIDISKCVFEFNEAITNDYVKEAYFTLNNNTYKQIIINDECSFPSEVLETKGMIEIGVVAYLVENEQEIKRYNPSPVYFNTLQGSLKEAQNSEPITPSEMEQFEQELQEGLNEMEIAIESAEKLDIDVNKVGGTTTVEITKQDGTTKTVEVIDGIGLDYNWNGTSLGVKREDENNYSYANLKGDKGDAGAIKFEIVVESLIVQSIVLTRIVYIIICLQSASINTPLTIKSNASITSLCALGSHHDNTVSTTSTIQCVRCSILLHGD